MDGTRQEFRARERGGGRTPRRGSGFFRNLGRLARASGALIRDHALLAREEAKLEGRRVAVYASVGMAALPFALTALIMLSVALAVGLSSWLGVAWAFLVVGLLDLVIAGILGAFAALRLKDEPSRALSQTKAEFAENKRMARRLVTQMRGPPPRAAIPLHGNSHGARLPEGGIHVADRPSPRPEAGVEGPAEHP